MKNPLLPLALLAALLHLRAEPPAAPRAEAGKPFPVYTLKDAHDVEHTLAKDTRFVIITSEKDISGKVSDWLKAQPAGYLAEHKTEVVSDITPMPAVITSLFAKPKMKKYPYTLLLADDKTFAEIYPAKKGHIALFVLDEKQVLTRIDHHPEAKDVAAVIEAAFPAKASP